MYLVEDGSGPHRRKSTRAARESLGIKTHPHPPSSPDLNPIEPLWYIIKKHVAEVPGSGKDLDSLWAAAKKVWDELTDEEVAAHTSQMDARVKAVKKAKGYQAGF
ncbi:Transposable element Tc1 transposase [Ceratobasidium sp. AG-Ba]|nr:Transposable element Tc1 transposase [Ceratobasidium sp. AG-Ba]